MDYEYYDESRTRFQLQSGPSVDPAEEKKKVDLVEVGSCFSLALLLLGFAWFSEGFLQFLLLWVASALLFGPFAPLSATGGSCRVGVGDLLPAKEEQELVETEGFSARNSKQRRKSYIEEPVLGKMRREGNSNDDMKHHKGKNGELADDTDENEDDNDDDDDGDVDVDVDDVNDDDVYDYDGDVGRKADVSNGSQHGRVTAAKSEAEWTSADIDLLKKLMVRYPRGMLKRWEVIAEAFDGSHSVESIVKMSKATGERKKGSDDSYSDFLVKRKGSANAIASPLSQRWDSNEALVENSSLKKSGAHEEVQVEVSDGLSKIAIATQPHGEVSKKSEWTETEDKALLNALKNFPKDTPMRWEKVAIAVPSRTKQQCFRRFAQLKEGFRNNKVEKV